jgi:hypothetical protein
MKVTYMRGCGKGFQESFGEELEELLDNNKVYRNPNPLRSCILPTMYCLVKADEPTSKEIAVATTMSGSLLGKLSHK